MPDTESPSTTMTSKTATVRPPQGVVREPDKDTEIKDIASLLRTLTEVAAKGPLGIENDDCYKEQLSQIQKVSEENITKIVAKHEESMQKKATRAIFDPAEEFNSVDPPNSFGNEEISDATNKEIREWMKDNRNLGPKWPTANMVLQKMCAVHEKHPEISESAWRERLVSMFPDAKQRETMEWYRQKKVPASTYFPQMLKTYKSHMSKSEAQMELNKVVTNMSSNSITVLENIEKYVRLIEIDPEQHLYTCRNEANRYMTLYAGPAMSETLILAYNMKVDKSFRTYIEVAKQFENKIREEHEKMMESNTKKVRQVTEGTNDSESSTSVQQTKVEQQQPRACHICGSQNHLMRDCTKRQQANMRYQPRLCALHPNGFHSDGDCRNQQEDFCTHPQHVGRAKHSNQACSLQRRCKMHGGAHLERDCQQQQNRQQYPGQQQNQQQQQRSFGQQQRPFRQQQRPNNNQQRYGGNYGQQNSQGFQQQQPFTQQQKYQQRQQQWGQAPVAQTNQVQLDRIQQQVEQLVETSRSFRQENQ